MTFFSKVTKLATLMRDSRFRSALIGHKVAAATEHLDIIGFCAPATLIDVGANKGQFSVAVRALFPHATIHAFEPLPAAADRYEAVFAQDSRAHLHRVAIGATAMTTRFYVTDREDSSSLLKPGAGQKAAFGVCTAREIEVEVKPLESVIDTVGLTAPVMMKIDVQGAELDVLKGIASLDRYDFIYVELSFVELYEGQPLLDDVEHYLKSVGFTLRGVSNQAFTEQFGPTQADCLFVRTTTEKAQ